jgi:hypothetical protein
VSVESWLLNTGELFTDRYYFSEFQSPVMVSRENQVIIGFGLLAIVLLVAIANFTNLPTWVSIAVVLIVGVIVPQFLNQRANN